MSVSHHNVKAQNDLPVNNLRACVGSHPPSRKRASEYHMIYQLSLQLIIFFRLTVLYHVAI
jgi:hypothetical protein